MLQPILQMCDSETIAENFDLIKESLISILREWGLPAVYES